MKDAEDGDQQSGQRVGHFSSLYIYICFFLSFCFFFLLESGCIAFFLWQRVGRSIRAAAFIRFPSSEAQHPAPSSDDGREITLHTHIHKRGERERESKKSAELLYHHLLSPSTETSLTSNQKKKKKKKKNLENPGVYDARLSTLFFCSSSGAHIFIHTYV